MIEVTDLLKTFDQGRVRAVDNISFRVPPGQVLTLLGPSGCGKTTTMRSIAGLEKPDSGKITIGDRTVFSPSDRVNLRPNQRGVGMVFQSYAIWPHMTVLKNVSYPLKGNRGIDRATVQERSMGALRLVGLEELADRRAPNLSGGQQQRVALARALVAEPEVLLLDEPLSNLDAKLRETMRQEIRELQQSLGITTLYVTHDQMEALAISDLVAVMSRGRIIDFGPPERIYAEPRSRGVAEFIGMANIVDVTDITRDGSSLRGKAPLGPITFRAQTPPADRCSLLIRLEDIELVGDEALGSPNVWPATVVSALYLGAYVDCVFQIGEERVKAQVSRRERPVQGTAVNVRVDPASCYVLPEGDPVEGVGDGLEGDSTVTAKAATA